MGYPSLGLGWASLGLASPAHRSSNEDLALGRGLNPNGLGKQAYSG